MKKLNKKGFTLAELLIVIAIIAVLIAIAIPTFAGALENAKRQTDHANMRNAYAMAQVANLNGGVFLNDSGTKLYDSTDAKLYFGKNGSLIKTFNADSAYKIQAAHTPTGSGTISDCVSAVACTTTVAKADVTTGRYIVLEWKTATNQWEVSVCETPAGP